MDASVTPSVGIASASTGPSQTRGIPVYCKTEGVCTKVPFIFARWTLKDVKAAPTSDRKKERRPRKSPTCNGPVPAEREDFPNVERFFRETVDPTVQKMGYRRLEMGTDRTEHGFINVEIFERLHYSEVAIVDVTGERPNCFVELGYALGHGVPVIVTAKEGTTLPFDQQAIPCHFWKIETDAATNRKLLLEFIEKSIGRPPLVTA